MFPTKSKELPEEILNEAREIIAGLKWQEAKTYAKTAPHAYALNTKNPYAPLSRLAFMVQEYGIIEYYYNTPAKYLYVDDYKYFGYEPEIKEAGKAWFINRALAKVYYGDRNKND